MSWRDPATLAFGQSHALPAARRVCNRDASRHGTASCMSVSSRRPTASRLRSPSTLDRRQAIARPVSTLCLAMVAAALTRSARMFNVSLHGNDIAAIGRQKHGAIAQPGRRSDINAWNTYHGGCEAVRSRRRTSVRVAALRCSWVKMFTRRALRADRLTRCAGLVMLSTAPRWLATSFDSPQLFVGDPCEGDGSLVGRRVATTSF